ncbi:preprotein translocase subunit SecA, partial [Mycolicibacterium elephantis]
YCEDWDLEQLWTALRQLYPVGIDHRDLLDSDAVGEPGELTREELLEALIADAERAYAEREKQIEEIAGEGAMRQLERNVLLNVLDRKWREHLYEMDYLKEGIGLRAMAQRDPLVEYQREGYDMFVGMLEGLKEESVGFLFNVQVEPAPAPAVAPVAAPSGLAEFAAAAAAKATEEGAVATKERPAPAPLRAKGIDNDSPPLTYTGPSEDGSAQVQRSGGGGGRHAAGGGSRRERREAARKQARAAKASRRR